MRRTLQQLLTVSLAAATFGGCAAPAQQHDAAPAAEPDCHAPPDGDQPQYIVGYGSLMQDESRQRTAPQAGPAHPVEVSGFRRGWFARGEPVGFSTTFLGATPDANGRLNAVVYQVDAAGLRATDQREASYCRTQVPASAVALDRKSVV